MDLVARSSTKKRVYNSKLYIVQPKYSLQVRTEMASKQKKESSDFCNLSNIRDRLSKQRVIILIICDYGHQRGCLLAILWQH